MAGILDTFWFGTVILGILVLYCLGSCSTGVCEIGWSGPNCQKENVALNKSASQSSYFFFYYPSEYAVDGNTSHLRYIGNGSGQSKCIFTNTGVDFAWWTVDLREEYPIRDVKIYYRENYMSHLRGFSLLIGKDDDPSNQNECFHHTNETLSSEYTVHCQDTGRFINITNSRENPPYPEDYYYRAVLELCEVEVYVCANGTFGKDCSGLCYCKNQERCNVDTGLCSNGCLPNWTGNSCSTLCVDGPYGVGCSKHCSKRNCKYSNSSCNPADGLCQGGCASGWSGIDCSQVLTFKPNSLISTYLSVNLHTLPMVPNKHKWLPPILMGSRGGSVS
ncbi:hypothetical protein LOTGIDRAFT_152632 [Lottia gigantea]|uniref:Fucolectin tachylectin-4 pentraxin-1 domain-containing protein n=1 Tax=Lottia gigantea TaxID=225164 RepID=V4C778_LOTGI|nr:hypothetical protein LOTGIDRAFT_152632 [Lottia gigantea]ESO97539.1 hypothetical protein LOTGIDRAFT_152632 [Lottia gigantea]